MSWGEVFKINKNLKRSIDEQLRDMKYNPIRVITATGTFTPERTGLYKVICVGAGGSGKRYAYTDGGTYIQANGGGAGGVAIKTLRLDSSITYDVTVSTTSSFSNILTATKGGAAGNSSAGTGGTASGGDYNFSGGSGVRTESSTPNISKSQGLGGSVGVVITDLSRDYIVAVSDGYTICCGTSVLKYGAGGSVVLKGTASSDSIEISPLPGAVIIIPIEMEE